MLPCLQSLPRSSFEGDSASRVLHVDLLEFLNFVCSSYSFSFYFVGVVPREKIVSVVWRLWNTDTMRTETYFDDSLYITKHEIIFNLQMLLNVT